jgi:hypothetical protein
MDAALPQATQSARASRSANGDTASPSWRAAMRQKTTLSKTEKSDEPRKLSTSQEPDGAAALGASRLPAYRSPTQAPQIAKDLFATTARLSRPGLASAILIAAPNGNLGLLPLYDALFGGARDRGYRALLAAITPPQLEELRHGMREVEQGMARAGGAARYLKQLGPARAQLKMAALICALARAYGLAIIPVDSPPEGGSEAADRAMAETVRQQIEGGRNLLVLTSLTQILPLQGILLRGPGKGAQGINTVSASFANSFGPEAAQHGSAPSPKSGPACGRVNFYRMTGEMRDWMPS